MLDLVAGCVFEFPGFCGWCVDCSVICLIACCLRNYLIVLIGLALMVVWLDCCLWVYVAWGVGWLVSFVLC